MITLQELLTDMVKRGASDLHITVGVPPRIRVDGRLVPLETEPLSPEIAKALIYSALRDDQKTEFESRHELDLSFGVAGVSRFRANVFYQRGAIAAAFRQIPYVIRDMAELGLPPPVEGFTRLPNGLVLVTGPTGSGKSTTLAAMIDRINATRACHIVTIEDPIEYVHRHRKSIVNQREVGADTASFHDALKYVLRQDPDVILIGEMRDLETTQAALAIAETGHLVFATLHTNSSFESVNRIVDIFPSHQRQTVLTQLAFVLRGVLTQRLIPRKTGGGRSLVTEVLVCTQAVRAVIREGKMHQIYSLMQAGQKHGMQTINQSLCAAVLKGEISASIALAQSSDPAELERMVVNTGELDGASRKVA